ncbi:MAG: class B sortase [Bacilli bacterium]
MKQTIVYNNTPYAILDYITLGSSKYVLIINKSNNDLKCLKQTLVDNQNTFLEHNMDRSFLAWEINKIIIINCFLNKIKSISNNNPINYQKLIRSIKKFDFYISESDLLYYVMDNSPYQINQTSIANLDLFLSKTIDIIDHDNIINFQIIPHIVSNARPLILKNIIYNIFYRLDFNETIYVFTLSKDKKVFRSFIEQNNNKLSYKTLKNDTDNICLFNQNLVINYLICYLNKEIKNYDNIDITLIINSLKKIVFYIKESEFNKYCCKNSIQKLTTKHMINLLLFFEQTVKITEEDIKEIKPITPNLNTLKKPIIKKDSPAKKKQKFNTYTIIIIISIIVFIIGGFFLFKWYIDGAKSNNIQKNIKEKVEIKETSGGEAINPPARTEEIHNDYWDYMKMPLINVDFHKLLKINQDTVGWLQVSGTNINYPIVQSGDNDYYLHHAFNGSTNNAGWIFADYRNDLSSLDKNNVIYGHGRLDTTMFGSLKNILTSNWYNDSNNHVIKLSTLTQNTLWQVFSVYSINAESYYITTDFPTTNQYDQFLKTLKSRSIFSFSGNVNPEDKIITLSTCQDNYDHRVVMHAKLIKAETK